MKVEMQFLPYFFLLWQKSKKNNLSMSGVRGLGNYFSSKEN
jgi:hypothetical protein